jgi:hypothetical protein
MKSIKNILVALSGLVFIFIVVGYFFPNTREISKSLVIGARKEHIQPMINAVVWHGEVTFETVGDNTKVTWTESQDFGNNFINKWLGSGLQQLKQMAEK